MNEQNYYVYRDNIPYTKYTKQQIKSMIDKKGMSAVIDFLQEMDYPWMPAQWENLMRKYKTPKACIGKYLRMMRLKGYRDFGWQDSQYFTSLSKLPISSKEAYLEVNKSLGSDKIILTKRNDGDWDCVIEQISFDGKEYTPFRITGVVDKSEIPAIFTFKLNDGCLYKMEVIDTDATDN